MKVKVTAPYQVNWEGKNYTDGQTVDASDVDAQTWIAAGYAVAVKVEASKKAKAVKASKNKAVAASANKAVAPPFVAAPTTIDVKKP